MLQVPSGAMVGCRCWKPDRSRRITIRCSGLSCTTAYVVTGAPPGPVILNGSGCARPAGERGRRRHQGQAVAGDGEPADRLAGRVPPPRRRDRAVGVVHVRRGAGVVVGPRSALACGRPSVRRARHPAVAVTGAATGLLARAPSFSRPMPYPAKSTTTSTAPKAASRKLAPVRTASRPPPAASSSARCQASASS